MTGSGGPTSSAAKSADDPGGDEGDQPFVGVGVAHRRSAVGQGGPLYRREGPGLVQAKQAKRR
jgi:hypothetical protein